MPMLDYEGGKSRYLPLESTSSSWTEYTICINTSSEEVEVALQFEIESGQMDVTIRKEAYPLDRKNMPQTQILANVFLVKFGRTSTFSVRFGWNRAS